MKLKHLKNPKLTMNNTKIIKVRIKRKKSKRQPIHWMNGKKRKE